MGSAANSINNNFEKLACFSVPKNIHPIHHNYHPNHHNLTTKTPQLRTTFPETSLKNTNKTARFYGGPC
jgi:hypothetical protein